LNTETLDPLFIFAGIMPYYPGLVISRNPKVLELPCLII